MEIIKKIGNGSFGVVYEVVVDGKRRAAKTSVFGDDSIKKEIAQLERVNHINIVTVFGLQLHENVSYLIMEYMKGGSMRDLRGTKDFKLTDVINWFSQVAAGLAYLHAMTPQPILHRDIKPHNILLSKNWKIAKIGDFGTSRDLDSSMSNNIGTSLYMAPEVFQSRKYTEKCDVYSFGISLWEMLARKRPFAEYEAAQQIQYAAHKGKRPSFEGLGCHRILIDLISLCWHGDPTKRPVMEIVFKVLCNTLKLYKQYEMSTDLLKGKVAGYLDEQMILTAGQRKRNFLSNIERRNTDMEMDTDLSLLQWIGSVPLIESVEDSILDGGKSYGFYILQWFQSCKEQTLIFDMGDEIEQWSQFRNLDSPIFSIVDDNKYNGKFLIDEWASVEYAVDKMAEKIHQQRKGPFYASIGWLRNSEKLMICESETALKWYKTAIAKIGEVYPGAKLRVVDGESLLLGPEATALLPNEPSDPNSILEMLGKSNPYVPIKNWKVLEIEECPQSQIQVIFQLNNDSVKQLSQSKGILNYGPKTVRLNVFKLYTKLSYRNFYEIVKAPSTFSPDISTNLNFDLLRKLSFRNLYEIVKALSIFSPDISTNSNLDLIRKLIILHGWDRK